MVIFWMTFSPGWGAHSGTVTVYRNSTMIQGHKTKFTKQIQTGDKVVIKEKTLTVKAWLKIFHNPEMKGNFVIIPFKFRILLLLALFLSALFAIPLQAQQGLLLLEKGSAKVIGPKRTLLLRKPGTTLVLESSDRVQTGKDTLVKIKVRGKPELIELSSRSFFRMGKITRETSSVSLLTGKAQFKIKGKLKKKSKKKRFQIRTVTALIGVRGTDFVIGASNTQTSLLTISGSVSVAPVSMPDIEIDVPANQASTVPQGSTPTAPVEVPPKLRQQIVKGDSPGAFKIVKFGQAVDPEEVRKDNAEKKKKEEEEEKRQEEEKQKEENKISVSKKFFKKKNKRGL